MSDFSLATEQDDEVLRALLRDNAMPSWVSMVMAREPSWFAGAHRFGRDWAVIAREAGYPVGMYACCDQPVHLNGLPTELGYLGALRVAPAYRHRLRILREGYASLRALARPRQPEFWFTAIASGNQPARRVLEAGLPAMPRYRGVNDLLTLALPSARGRHHGLWRPARPEDMAALCAFHNRQASRFQFSPVLNPESAARTGAVFYLAERDEQVRSVMALWNQQGYKQILASAYRRPLGQLLPLYNAYARLAKRVPLPPVGGALDQTYLAFLALCPDEDDAPALIRDALALCTTPVLSLGLHQGHPALEALLAAFRPASYQSRLYTVDFDQAPALDGRPAQPEVALL